MVEADAPSRFEALWSVHETATYLGLAAATLYGWRGRGYGPPGYRLGNKVRYRPDEVRAWVAGQTSQAS
ncbi:Helix-turn-helix domain-containing protein [Nocardioides scoriae]|uniref:Helix-turn-helix domain-containing protein n=1 Tax=Nocardioides scoriae TaxID=642780 RepID=A0A1H1LN62_9ACTN|nr:helix-turn-helix domain-containing protein [Nocardioides scoriae]SDR75742.1 Helix-turn-helix domain-containing protein [Nocardioides scoriae]